MMLVGAVFGAGCDRIGFGDVEPISCGAGEQQPYCNGSDPMPAPPWADYVATLGLADCTSASPRLVVDTTSSELDGGDTISDPSQAGGQLSFEEAMWIANN